MLIQPLIHSFVVCWYFTQTPTSIKQISQSPRNEKKFQDTKKLRLANFNWTDSSKFTENWSNFTLCRPNCIWLIDIRPTYHYFHWKIEENKGKVAENYRNTPARSFYVISKALFELNWLYIFSSVAGMKQRNKFAAKRHSFSMDGCWCGC